MAGGEETFLEGSPGPWRSAAPSSPGLPVPLPSFINAAICGVKIPLLFASGSTEQRRGEEGAER